MGIGGLISESIKMEGFFQQLLIIAILIAMPVLSSSSTSQFQFNIEWKSVTRLCQTKSVLTVNGMYPGPTIAVHEGDNIQVKVTNKAARNTTIHWHGVRQMGTGWADGASYITQCPIGRGKSYVYRFSVAGQRGTLWWHAHFAWQRATLYGAFIIYPRMPSPYTTTTMGTFPSKPSNHILHNIPPLIFGEWWNEDVEVVESEMMRYGGGPKTSDAYTINGLPGPLYPCSYSTKDTFILSVEPGKTYLLRIINAALNDELFFAISNHNLTVVEIDSSYTKPFTTTAIMIAPGQTTNVLLTTDQSTPGVDNTFVMAARPYLTTIFPFNNSTTIGFLNYRSNTTTIFPTNYDLPHNLPAMQDTPFATRFSENLKSLDSPNYPCRVPRTIDKRVVTTISLNLQDCPVNQTCKGLRNKRFYASMNNQSFVHPTSSLLESHYRNFTILTSTFPGRPPRVFNYTGAHPMESNNMNTNFGTDILRVPFGTRLEIVFQGTSFLNPENHPMHVHGHNFFIVGTGSGDFDGEKDPAGYNLVDPPERNTAAVPAGGWAAVRLVADNPGVWFVHCHLEEHMSWGLGLGFVVENGKEPSECVLPPPSDLPPC